MANTLNNIIDTSSKLTSLNNLTLNLIAAIIILIIGLIVGKFLSNLIRKVLNELELDKILKEQARIKVPLTELISSITKYIIYFITIIISLNQLGLKSLILNLILATAMIILIVFVILSLKDFIPNLVAGLFLYQKRNFKEGDFVQVNNIEGEILSVTLLETRIKTKTNEVVYIPNSILTKSIVVKKRNIK